MYPVSQRQSVRDGVESEYLSTHRHVDLVGVDAVRPNGVRDHGCHALRVTSTIVSQRRRGSESKS